MVKKKRKQYYTIATFIPEFISVLEKKVYVNIEKYLYKDGVLYIDKKGTEYPAYVVCSKTNFSVIKQKGKIDDGTKNSPSK